MNDLIIFTGTSNPDLAQNICNYIGIPLGKGFVTHFPDGETIIKIEDDVRGKDCFIIQSTSTPVNDNIMELLIYVDCLRRASANSITVVVPYYGYARQDRKTEGRTPITAKMVADLMIEVGVNRILTIDLHSHQIEGFFSIPVDHLKSFPVFVKNLKKMDLKNFIILSPDVGNMKIAALYAQELNLELSVIDKKRISDVETVVLKIIGDVKDKNIFMFDDIISTAGTICSAAKMAKEKGAKKISIVATHGLFSGPACERLVGSCIDEIYISDTIPVSKKIKTYIDSYDDKKSNWPKIKVISVAKLLGEAILRIYQKRSVSVLLEANNDYM